MAGHHDPRLLYSIQNIKAFHIQNGEELPLTPSGAQTMSLLMVPTSSPFADLSSANPQNEAPEEDFYLHLHLPPELDLPLPATTQIYHKPPRSYLIPRWDMGPESGAFTRIEFPEKVGQEDVDTFETILAQCTAFLERAPAPTGNGSHKPYYPADWAAGGKYSDGSGKSEAGQLVLVDEENGSIVGELLEGTTVVEDPALGHGTKNPVEIHISADGKRVKVLPVSEDYLRLARHPAYASSSMVQNAAAASRLIVTGSEYLSRLMASGAESFTQKVTPAAKPLEFGPATHEHVRRLHSFTQSGANLSAKSVGQATKYAQNLGASLAKRSKDKGRDKDGNPKEGSRPGFLNKSMIAFTTIADGIAEGGRSLLTTGSGAASTVVGHKYGPEAGDLAGKLVGGVKNVGLVYIDVTGVSRRAVLKSVAKGMVVGHVKGGGAVVVGSGDGGGIPDADIQRGAGQAGVKMDPAITTPGLTEVGFGAAAAAAPQAFSDLGEPLGRSTTSTSTAGRSGKNSDKM